ncbi:MAG: hypothetical protein OSJ39_03565 [Clostridia bacterium]|jgi:hypothetical protein|nr:hypothetical protein [Clostridia bacterium]MCX4384857.1 hypothetical protein [Clostridia bacterium]
MKNRKKLKKAAMPIVPVKNYCLTCRLPASQCKGKCTLAQMKANGG